jgi:hypothetical protein
VTVTLKIYGLSSVINHHFLPLDSNRSASAWLASMRHILASRRVFHVTDQLGSV